MAYEGIILTVTVTGLSGYAAPANGAYVLTFYRQIPEDGGYEWTYTSYPIHVGVQTSGEETAGQTLVVVTYQGEPVFGGVIEGEFTNGETENTSHEEYGGTATVSGFLSKAINPTPSDGAVGVSKGITTFSWEIP